MSVVPRPGLKPHCVSGIILSERGCSRFRRTFAAGKCVGDINRSLTTKSKPLYNWIDANRMVLNAEKTECVLLGTRQKLRSASAAFCVHTDNRTVTSVDTHKLLGLHVDNSLTWSVHVTKLCSKLRSRL